jgi:membrane-associated phospholipid phosphatase
VLAGLARRGTALAMQVLVQCEFDTSGEAFFVSSRSRTSDPARRAALAAVLLALAVSLLSPRVLAQTAASPTVRSTNLRLNLPVDLGITIGGGVAWLSAELLTSKIGPSQCRWCDRKADGADDLNGFDSSLRTHLRWSNPRTAATLSGVFSFGLAPLAGTGIAAIIAAHDGRLRELPEDILVVAEAAVIAGGLTEAAKFSFARERPDAHARSVLNPSSRTSRDDNVSFFSGHASLAFALATSAGTVASMRRHRLAPVIWVAGFLFASTGAYLRVAADRHYATDVIAGGGVGSAVGFLVPYFAHHSSDVRVSTLFLEDGSGVCVTGVW